MRKCSKCGIEKTEDQFHSRGGGRKGLHSHCASCKLISTAKWRKRNLDTVRELGRRYAAKNRVKKREYDAGRYSDIRERSIENQRKYRKSNFEKVLDKRLWNRYRIRLETFNKLLVRQNYCCAICRNPFKPITHNSRNACVDHCKKTGYVRSLLCPKCNMAIGLLGHSAGIAIAAAHYLNQESIFNGEPLITPSVGRSGSKPKSVFPNMEEQKP